MTQETPYFVEVLDRSGAVTARHRFHGFPLSVGRGYDNDVIVDDPFLAPQHFAIELRPEDGALVARDAGSRNGIHAALLRGGAAKAAPGEIELTADVIVRAGHSWFRIRRADHPVAPERIDRTAHAWEGRRPALLALAIASFLALFEGWSSNTSTGNDIEYAKQLAAVAAVIIGWAGAWAVLNRIFAGRARFGRHLLIAAIGLASIAVAEHVFEIAAYAFSFSWLSMYGIYLAFGVLAVVVYFHAATLRPLAPGFARVIAAGFAVLATGLVALTSYASDQTVADSRYMTALKWPGLRVANPISSEAFAKTTAELAARAEARRNDLSGVDEQ